jgi:hypothetical protein
MEEPYPLHPFLFTGCWNEPGPGRDAVAKAISDNPIKTLILGGDNIYTERGPNGSKIEPRRFSMATVDDGFARLGADKLIYTALGNHNIVDPAIKARMMAIGRMDTTYYCKIFMDGCAIVVLDTNLIDAEWVGMVAWLRETVHMLQERALPYYLIQHDPFRSYKKEKMQELPNGMHLLDAVDGYPPILILCADTHNYQVGSITTSTGKKIRQVVAGAGGANFDPIIAKVDPVGVGHIPYQLEEHIPGFGYLEVKELRSYEFKKIMEWPAKGGGRRRRRGWKSIRRRRKNSRGVTRSNTRR